MTRTASPRKKRLSSGERRQEFISKAIEFFAEEGFESSTRKLARRLGVTQPLLYRYFPSKDDLIKEVYQTVYLNRWQSRWDELLCDRSRPLEEHSPDAHEVLQRDPRSARPADEASRDSAYQSPE